MQIASAVRGRQHEGQDTVISSYQLNAVQTRWRGTRRRVRRGLVGKEGMHHSMPSLLPHHPIIIHMPRLLFPHSLDGLNSPHTLNSPSTASFTSILISFNLPIIRGHNTSLS
jgi:hypothetical protein